MFHLEFSSPSELLVLALAVILFICLFQAWRTGNGRLFRRAAGLVGLFLLVAGTLILSGLAMGILPGFLVYSGCSAILICGLSLILGGVASFSSLSCRRSGVG